MFLKSIQDSTVQLPRISLGTYEFIALNTGKSNKKYSQTDAFHSLMTMLNKYHDPIML